MEASNLGGYLAGASKKHRNEQKIVCRDDYFVQKDIDMPAIGMSYYLKFIYFNLTIFVIAFVSLIYENIAKINKRIKRNKIKPRQSH